MDSRIREALESARDYLGSANPSSYNQLKDAVVSGLDYVEQALSLLTAEPCTWTEDAEGGVWNTSCGKSWALFDGTPEENGVKYCHHCRRPVVRVAFTTVDLPKYDHCGAIACGTDCDGSSHYMTEKKE